jgi:hypothetical protein
MNDVHVGLLAQIADKKATEFAGKLGDSRLTQNWNNRYNGYFHGYMHREADDYVRAESKKILDKMGKDHSDIPGPTIPPHVENDPLEDLLGVAEGEDLLG